MIQLGAGSGSIGIGRSIDSIHLSECGYWDDFSGVMSLFYPAMLNRAECRAIFECTPTESGDDWHEHYMMAKAGGGRHMAMFLPMWDSKLNRRSWVKGDRMDNEEIALMNRYPLLTMENMAFRRYSMRTDRSLARNPSDFFKYYPVDDVTCWGSGKSGMWSQEVLDVIRQAPTIPMNQASTDDLGIRYFYPRRPGARYIIGVDPCGHAARDEAAVIVLEATVDAILVVAQYRGHVDPLTLLRVLERLVANFDGTLFVESTGVGQGILTALRGSEICRNKIHHHNGLPGIPASSGRYDACVEMLCDMILNGDLHITSADLQAQLLIYKNDGRVAQTVNQEILAGVVGASTGKRRKRHHYDLVLAMLWAVYGVSVVGPAPIHLDTPSYHPAERRAWMAMPALKKKHEQEALRRMSYGVMRRR